MFSDRGHATEIPPCSLRGRKHGYVGCRKNWACVHKFIQATIPSYFNHDNDSYWESCNLEAGFGSEFSKGPTRPNQHTHLRAKFPVTCRQWGTTTSGIHFLRAIDLQEMSKGMVNSSRVQLEALKQSHQQNSDLILAVCIYLISHKSMFCLPWQRPWDSLLRSIQQSYATFPQGVALNQ